MGICLSELCDSLVGAETTVVPSRWSQTPPSRDHPQRCLNMSTRWLLAPCLFAADRVHLPYEAAYSRAGNITNKTEQRYDIHSLGNFTDGKH
jgi:hypothetical protein